MWTEVSCTWVQLSHRNSRGINVGMFPPTACMLCRGDAGFFLSNYSRHLVFFIRTQCGMHLPLCLRHLRCSVRLQRRISPPPSAETHLRQACFVSVMLYRLKTYSASKGDLVERGNYLMHAVSVLISLHTLK